MTLTQIQCFLAAAEMKSFSQAAEKLYITRPAVSKQVAQMEEEMGFPLFVRVHGGLEMTELGKEVYPVFQESYDNIQNVISRGKHIYHQKTKKFRVGCMWGWDFQKIFGQMISRLYEETPGLEIELEGFGYLDLLPALKRGDMDYIVGIDNFIQGDSEMRLEYRKIATVPGKLLYSNRHKLKNKETLCLADFQNELFLVSGDPANPELAVRPLMNACQKYGFCPRMEVVSDGSIIRRIQNGQGVWVVDNWYASVPHALINVLPIDISFNICLAWIPIGEEPTRSNSLAESILHYCEQHPLTDIVCE